MIFSSLAVLLAGLSLNVSIKNGSTLVHSYNLSASQYIDIYSENTQFGDTDDYLLVHNLPINLYSYESQDYSVELNFYYTYNDNGNNVNALFIQYFWNGTFDANNDCMTVSQQGVFGYLGTCNVYFDYAYFLYTDDTNVNHSYQLQQDFSYIIGDVVDDTWGGLNNKVISLKLNQLIIYKMASGTYNSIHTGVSGDSYDSGYQVGKQDGYSIGLKDGINEGYQSGYDKGRADFENQDEIVTSIFDGILGIGLLPVEFLMSIFNFEILGINFTHIVSALLSIMVLVILLRIVLGGKGGEK